MAGLFALAAGCSVPATPPASPPSSWIEVDARADSPGVELVMVRSWQRSQRGQLFGNHETVCALPCSALVDPAQSFVIRGNDEDGRPYTPHDVHFPPGGAVALSASMGSSRASDTGMLLAGLGGLPLLAGVTGTAVSIARDELPAHTAVWAGLAGIGVALVAVGVVLYVRNETRVRLTMPDRIRPAVE
jgi:hypothetical protein